MTFRVQADTDQEGVTFSLSGDFDRKSIAEVRKLLRQYTNGHRMIFDLAEVGLVDRNALRSLATCESKGVELRNSPPYVRDWISKEQRSVRKK